MVGGRRAVTAHLPTALILASTLLVIALAAVGCDSPGAPAGGATTSTGAGSTTVAGSTGTADTSTADTSTTDGVSSSAATTRYTRPTATMGSYPKPFPVLTPYLKNLFLSWKQGSDALACYNGDPRELWTFRLDGYAPSDSSTSPDTSRALILATKIGDDTACRLLLVDPISNIRTVTVLREFRRGQDTAGEIRLSRDGRKAALMLAPAGPSTGDESAANSSAADASAVVQSVAGQQGETSWDRLEIMDNTGSTLHSFLSPEGRSIYSWAVDDDMGTVALSFFSPRGDDGTEPAGQVRIFRDSTLIETLALSAPGWVDLSPDGQSLVIATRGTSAEAPGIVALYSLDTPGTAPGDAHQRWSVTVSPRATFVGFVNDGRLLLVEDGSFFSSGLAGDKEAARGPLLFLSPADGSEVWSAPDKYPNTGVFATLRYGSLFAFQYLMPSSSWPGIVGLDVGGPTPIVDTEMGDNYSMLTFAYDGTAAVLVSDVLQVEGGPLPRAGASSDWPPQ